MLFICPWDLPADPTSASLPQTPQRHTFKFGREAETPSPPFPKLVLEDAYSWGGGGLCYLLDLLKCESVLLCLLNVHREDAFSRGASWRENLMAMS